MKENTNEETTSGGGNGKPEAAAGLPGAPTAAHRTLHEAGIDPDRLSILQLGSPSKQRKHRVPPWARRMAVGYLLWLLLFLFERFGVAMSVLVTAVLSLFVGLVILQVACQVLVTAAERFAARMGCFRLFIHWRRCWKTTTRWESPTPSSWSASSPC
jgi:hypothetical protein